MNTLRIVPFQPEFAGAFADLNREWIAAYFSFEAHDHELLGDPQGSIIDAGGEVFFALDERDQPIGCCALLPRDEETIEIGKTAVTTRAQGQGAGRLLVEHAIAEARRRGARRVYLETNSCLASANRLYEKLGFVDLPPERIVPSDYSRTNRYMELWLV